MLLYSGSYSVGLFQHQRSPVRVQSSANFLMEHLFTVNCIEMTKIMKKEAGVRNILNKDWKLFCFHFCLLHSFRTLNAPKFWSVKAAAAATTTTTTTTATTTTTTKAERVIKFRSEKWKVTHRVKNIFNWPNLFDDFPFPGKTKARMRTTSTLIWDSV